MAKLGIDFGTSNTTVAWVDPRTGRPSSFRIEGEEKIPSVVYFPPNEASPSIGSAAMSMYEMANDITDPEERMEFLSGVISGIKQNMDEDSKIYLPDGKIKSYTDILAIFLESIKKEVDRTLRSRGQEASEACITHPVNFSTEKKRILKTSAERAGFKKIHLLEEPVAASFGYESDDAYKGKGIMIYDFGGGTFDLAYIKFDSNGDRFMLPPLGDAECGGEKIDRLLYDLWDKTISSESGRHISDNEYQIDLSFLKKTCEHQKKFLSVWHQKTSDDYRLRASRFGKPFEMNMSRMAWEGMISPIIDRTISLVGEMMARIEEENLTIDRFLLIGGSSRIPLVGRRLQEEFDIAVDNVPEQDIAVALGALSFITGNLPEVKTCYCIKCGQKLTTKMRFCLRCGKDNYRYNHRLR